MLARCLSSLTPQERISPRRSRLCPERTARTCAVEAVAGQMTRTGSFPAVGQPPRAPSPRCVTACCAICWASAASRSGGAPATGSGAVLGALVVTAIAAGARLWELGRPGKLVFDETYYVKEGWSLASLGFEAAWPDKPNPAFEAGDVSSYRTDEAEYVVHPPVGKWMIAIGMRLMGGADNPMAWRIASAVIGILAVLLMVRIARRMFSSTLLGLVAGLLLAVDGEAIVHSRTGLLDQFLMFWVLVAFGCLVLDREWARRRLADRVAQIVDGGRGDRQVRPAARVPRLAVRGRGVAGPRVRRQVVGPVLRGGVLPPHRDLGHDGAAHRRCRSAGGRTRWWSTPSRPP